MDDDLEITILEDDDLPQHAPTYQKDTIKVWYSPNNVNVRIICSSRVLETVESYSKENNRKEVGGILLGRAYRHDGNIYVEVNEFIRAPGSAYGQSGVSHFTFTDQAWSEMLRIKDTQFENLRIVGWFHSHPGHHVFLSPMDLGIHNGHFKSPWHVALVYDPNHHEGGFFVWERGKIISAPGFLELFNPGQKKSVLNWKKPDSFEALPVPPPSNTPWWKNIGTCGEIALYSILLILLGMFIFNLLFFNQQIQTLNEQIQTFNVNILMNSSDINALKLTVAVVDKKIPTITSTETTTATLTRTPWPTGTKTPIKPTNTSTMTATSSVTPSTTITPTPGTTPTQ